MPAQIPILLNRSATTAGQNNALAYTNKVLALSPIAYWPMAESSGTTAQDASGNGRTGAYTAVTLGQPGIGDGRTSASFDGSTSFNNVFTASLQGAFPSAEGTVALWLRVSGAGVWTDATVRRCATFQVDGNNRVLLQRSATNNQIQVFYSAGGTTKGVSVTTNGELTFLHLAITWSKSGDAVKCYYGGAQSGATQTGLGVWSGSIASTTTAVGAASTTPGNVWSGTLAHVALFGAALTAAQVASLAVVP